MGAGEHAGLDRIADALNTLLADTTTRLLLETTAGQGRSLGHRLEHLTCLIDRCAHKDRLGVCLDTCHVFAAGYPIHQRDGYEQFIDRLDRLIGLKKLACIHVNDSKAPFASGIDRHEHIGKGRIGSEGFAFVLNDPRLADVPKILETPKGDDPLKFDRLNLCRLRRLCRHCCPAPRRDL